MLAALLSAALLLPVVAVAPALALGEVGCTNEISTYLHNHHDIKPLNFTTVRGIRSVIWSTARIWRCTSPAIWANTGASAWVAIEPGPGTPYFDSTNAIMQIGIMHCFDEPADGCSNGEENQKWVFYALGGCGAGGGSPIARPMALAPSGGIDFRISRQTNGNWLLSYDALDGSSGGSVTVLPTDAAIQCWEGDGEMGDVDCERHDHGDACGSVTQKVAFRDIREQKSVGGYWFYPSEIISGTQYGYSLADGSCGSNVAEDICDVRSDTAPAPGRPDDIDMWTTN